MVHESPLVRRLPHVGKALTGLEASNPEPRETVDFDQTYWTTFKGRHPTDVVKRLLLRLREAHQPARGCEDDYRSTSLHYMLSSQRAACPDSDPSCA